jgi:oligosaccharide repeat unit polymerase
MIILLFLKTKKMYFSPVIITLFMFFISMLFYSFGMEKWGYPFYFDTFLCVLLFYFCLFVIGLFFSHNVKRIKIGKKILCFKFNKTFLLLFNAILFALFMLYFYEVKKIGSIYGLGIKSSISFVKENYQELNSLFNPIIRQFYKIVIASAFVSSFFLANEILTGTSKENVFLLAFPVFLGMIINVVSGSRGDILLILGIFGLSFAYLSFFKTKKFKFKISFYFLLLGLLALVVFYLATAFVKTSDTLMYSSTIADYLEYGVGGSIQVLNLKIHIGLSNFHVNAFAYSSFNQIYNLFGFNPEIKNEFIYLNLNKTIGGNVGTILLGFLSDFGFYPGLFLIFLFFMFSEFCFMRISKQKSPYNVRFLIFVIFLQVFVFSSYSSIINKVFQISGFLTLICTIIIWMLFTKVFIAKRKTMSLNCFLGVTHV